MSTIYIDVPITTDPDTLAQEAFDFIQAQIPGWVPNAGNLDTWIIEAVARMAAETATIASAVPASIFRYFGPLVGIQPINATPASVTALFTAVDNAGYTIPAGTLVGIPDSSGNTVPFALTADLVIAEGDTTGTATVTAINAGAAGSGLGGNGDVVPLITTLASVASVTLQAASSGGVDAETDSDYLNRLADELRLLAPRPILPDDFATLARTTAGVQRALAIDGYDPAVNEVQQLTVNATGGTFTLSFGGHTTSALAYNAAASAVQAALQALSSIGSGNLVCTGGPLATSPVTITFQGSLAGADQAAITTDSTSLTGGTHTAAITTLTNGAAATTGNERTVAVALVDAAGNAVDATVKNAVQASLEAQREINFVVNVIDPTYTEIDVSFTIAALDGYDPDAVTAAAAANVTSFLDPSAWGLAPSRDLHSWINNTTVRLLDLATVIKNTPGVAYITVLELATHGGSLGSSDVALTGVAPLPTAGTITGAHT